MKKIFTIVALLGMLGLGSCKQNWVCQCMDEKSNVTNTPINGGTFTHAERTCHAMSGKCSLITEGR